MRHAYVVGVYFVIVHLAYKAYETKTALPVAVTTHLGQIIPAACRQTTEPGY